MRTDVVTMPLTKTDVSSLLHAVEHLALDEMVRTKNYRTIDIVDFALLYVYQLESTATPNFGPIRYWFEHAPNRLLLVPPSEVEMERVYRGFDDRVRQVNWDDIEQLRKQQETQEFLRAFGALKGGTTDVLEVWDRYRRLQARHSSLVRTALFAVRLKSDIIAPTERIVKLLQGEKPFISQQRVLSEIGAKRFARDRRIYQESIAALMSWRTGSRWRSSNVTDAQVYAICFEANAAGLKHEHKIYFRNISTGMVAEVFSNKRFLVPGLQNIVNEPVSLCRDVRAALLEIVSLERRTGDAACFPSWKELEALLRDLLEVMERAERLSSERKYKLLLEQTRLFEKVRQHTYRDVMDALVYEPDVAVIESAGSELDDFDHDVVELRQLGELRRMGEFLARIHAAGFDQDRDEIERRFSDAFASLVDALRDAAGGKRRWEAARREYISLRKQIGDILDALAELEGALSALLESTFGTVESRQKERACAVAIKKARRIDAVKTEDALREAVQKALEHEQYFHAGALKRMSDAMDAGGAE